MEFHQGSCEGGWQFWYPFTVDHELCQVSGELTGGFIPSRGMKQGDIDLETLLRYTFRWLLSQGKVLKKTRGLEET